MGSDPDYQYNQHWFKGYITTLEIIQEDPAWRINPEEKITSVEIGVYEGMSTVHTLESFHKNPESLHIAIDPFTGSSEHINRKEHFPELDSLEARARRNIALHPEGKKCRVMPYTSEDAAPMLHKEYGDAPWIDYLYIDGGHEENFVKSDIENYVPMVKVGGLICFDDYFWPHVRKAVDENLHLHCEFVRRHEPVGQFLCRKVS